MSWRQHDGLDLHYPQPARLSLPCRDQSVGLREGFGIYSCLSMTLLPNFRFFVAMGQDLSIVSLRRGWDRTSVGDPRAWFSFVAALSIPTPLPR